MGFNSSLLVTLLLISILGLSMVGFIMGNITTAGVEVDPEYAAMFDTFEQSNDVYLTQQEIIEGGEINPEGSDLAVTKDTIISFKSIQSAGEVAVNMTRKMGQEVGIAGSVLTIIFSIIFLASLLGVLYAISGRKP